jgi:putative ABC transport system permease protein
VERLDPDLPVYGAETMQEQVDKALFLPRAAAVLLTAFGILALTLAGMGLYGVMSYSVACRTREIGIRMALGATATGTVRRLAKEGLTLVGAGLAVGFGIAAAVSRFADSFLYGVSSADPLTFAVVPLVLLSAGCLAITVPARQATKADPMVALRYE